MSVPRISGPPLPFPFPAKRAQWLPSARQRLNLRLGDLTSFVWDFYVLYIWMHMFYIYETTSNIEGAVKYICVCHLYLRFLVLYIYLPLILYIFSVVLIYLFWSLYIYYFALKYIGLLLYMVLLLYMGLLLYIWVCSYIVWVCSFIYGFAPIIYMVLLLYI